MKKIGNLESEVKWLQKKLLQKGIKELVEEIT